MDVSHLPPLMQRIVKAKEERRKEQAALSWPEKIAAIVRMQERYAPIYRARGRDYFVWQLPSDDPAMKYK